MFIYALKRYLKGDDYPDIVGYYSTEKKAKAALKDFCDPDLTGKYGKPEYIMNETETRAENTEFGEVVYVYPIEVF